MSTNIATQTESNVKTAQPEHSSGKSVRLHYLDWLRVLATLDLESGPRPEGEIYEEREPVSSRFPHINCQTGYRSKLWANSLRLLESRLQPVFCVGKFA